MRVETENEYFEVKRVLIAEKKELIQKNVDKEIRSISILQKELNKLVAPFWQISFNKTEIFVNESKDQAKNPEDSTNCVNSGCTLL